MTEARHLWHQVTGTAKTFGHILDFSFCHHTDRWGLSQSPVSMLSYHVDWQVVGLAENQFLQSIQVTATIHNELRQRQVGNPGCQLTVGKLEAAQNTSLHIVNDQYQCTLVEALRNEAGMVSCRTTSRHQCSLTWESMPLMVPEERNILIGNALDAENRWRLGSLRELTHQMCFSSRSHLGLVARA